MMLDSMAKYSTIQGDESLKRWLQMR